MHQTRSNVTKRLPIKRKGTKYVAVASSHVNNSVPVVIAIRDMLNLAKTAKEVNEMIKAKVLKLNGKIVKDYHESIKLFNVLDAEKKYKLTILPTGKFALEETKEKNDRLCKVVNRRLLGKGEIQLNLHDGTNLVSKDKINVGDSLYLDFSGKVKKHLKLEKGADAFIISGRYVGTIGKIEGINGKNVKIKFKEGFADLNESQAVVI